VADVPDLGGTAALAGAVVALARVIEYIITKLRSSSEAAPLEKLEDRLTALDTRTAVLESRGPINDTRFEEVIRRLERLDEKLDRTLSISKIHRGEF
jgi:hypothetical protein